MSIIQQIREKAAWLVFGFIALSLLGFLLMDARPGSGGLFSSNSTTIGKINGKKIDYVEYQQKLKQIEEQYASQGYPMDESMRQNLNEQLWNQYVEDAILGKEIDKLGMQISNKELGDILYGANPPRELKQAFIDSTTGAYNATAAYSAIRGLKKNSPQYNNFWGEFVPALENQRKKEKYMALLTNSSYIPKWLMEKRNSDNSGMASISYVSIPYSTIADSTIKVTDEEINKYVSEHKDGFKQEASRSIYYVSFDASPSKKDSMAIYDAVIKAKDALAAANTTAEVQNVLNNSGSETPFLDGYVLSSHMQMANADTLRKLADGAVFGPYLDGGNYTLAKMVGRRSMPDSVKSRHILIKIADQQGQTRADSTAKKLIDSIEAAIKGGASFEEMVTKYSDDAGSKAKGGEYEFSSMQFSSLSKEFAEVIFYGNTGDKKVVKVENGSYSGYHYIEVLSQKKIETAYKIAYLSKAISPSNETDNIASGAANQFAGESRNPQAFEDNITKRKYKKLIATDIKPIDASIMGVGNSRQLVKWIYDADRGDISEPIAVGDKYIVAMVYEINKKGVMNAAKARPMVEGIIRNKKKADVIVKKIGNATSSLDVVAKAANQPVLQADSVQFSAFYVPNMGNETKLIGASFNKANQSKVSAPIIGQMGVFYIKVNSVSALPNSGMEMTMQMEQARKQLEARGGYTMIEALRKSADIKDNRAKFF